MLGRLLGVNSRNVKVVVHNRSEVSLGRESSDVHSEGEHSEVGHSDVEYGSHVAGHGGHGAEHDHSVANERDAGYDDEPVYSRYS